MIPEAATKDLVEKSGQTGKGLRRRVQLCRTLTKFFRCRRGVSVVEFALAAPVFVLLLTGVLEFSLILFSSVLAEGGMREAARYGITGQVPGSMSREAMLVQIVEENTQGLIQVSPSNVTFKVYDDFSQVGNGEPYTDDSPANGQYDDGEAFDDVNGNGTWDEDLGEDGVGDADSIVLYTIEYQWEFMTPLFAVFGGEDGAIDLSASIAVQNEPYAAAEGGS